ncbi:MAG: hypothetical protein LC798_12965 [Chloroflexi bacterium]|nr:hypothetical protein [Chloroflexota bacterium]
MRLAGLRPSAGDLIAVAMEESDARLLDGVDVRDGPEGWQIELRVSLRHDDLQSAIVLTTLMVRRAIWTVKTPVERMAVAGTDR